MAIDAVGRTSQSVFGRPKMLAGDACWPCSHALAVAVFAVIEAAVKWLFGVYPALEIVFFRNASALSPLLLLFRRGEFRGGI